MIGLDREDAGGGLEVGLVRDQRRGALVGGDADVLEDERAEQEVLVARVRVERLAGRSGRRPSRRPCERCVRATSIDGLRDRGDAERAAQERDVGDLVAGDLAWRSSRRRDR